MREGTLQTGDGGHTIPFKIKNDGTVVWNLPPLVVHQQAEDSDGLFRLLERAEPRRRGRPDTPEEGQQALTAKQIAKMMALSPATVYRMLKANAFPGIKPVFQRNKQATFRVNRKVFERWWEEEQAKKK